MIDEKPKSPEIYPGNEEKILYHLRKLDPPMRTLTVDPPDASKNIYFLDLSTVCYITSRSDQKGDTMFVTLEGKKFYNSMGIGDIEKKICEPFYEWDDEKNAWELQPHEGGNPWFLRTHSSYIVNLKHVRRVQFAKARTVWFDSLEEPIENIVSESRREAFDASFLGL